MTAPFPTDWEAKLTKALDERPAGDSQDYGRADAESIERALAGLGPEDKVPVPGGARVVFNMASVHVPAFVDASVARETAPYMNRYDIDEAAAKRSPPSRRIGADPRNQSRRARMDSACSQVVAEGCAPRDLYYGAVELNGTGVRFYGDISLVLADTDAGAVILDRNSYDLLRAPLANDSSYKDGNDFLIVKAALRIAGRWANDLPAIAALKILSLRPVTGRRITTGNISDGLLHDEDYIEVLRRGSFSAADLQEARITAADAAREALVRERERHGATPNIAASAWAQQRRAAEHALARANVAVRTITESGRVKS